MRWIAVFRLKSRYRRYEDFDDAMLVRRSGVPHSRLLLGKESGRRANTYPLPRSCVDLDQRRSREMALGGHHPRLGLGRPLEVRLVPHVPP